MSYASTFLARAGERVARLDRRPVAHRIILFAIPRAATVLFDADAATDLEARFELRLRDPRGGEPDCYTIAVSDGRCQVRRGAAGEAGAAVAVAAGDLLRMVSGAVGWPELLSRGRLELTGNPFLALRFPGLFRLPAVASPRPAARPSTPRPGRIPSWARSRRRSRSSRSAATS